MRDLNASYAMVVRSLKKCERFSAKSSEEKLKFLRDRKLFETVCPIRVLLLVPRVHVRVILTSALFPVSTCALFMMPFWLAFAEDKKIANDDLVLDQTQILRSPEVITLL